MSLFFGGLVVLVLGLGSTPVWAVSDLTINGGAAVNGYVDTYLPVDDLEVTGTDSPSVPVDLYVPYGSLSMTTTTGLTFNTDTSGQHLNFEGSLSDVNAALATLRYRNDRPKAIQLSVSITGSNQVYNPSTGHLYEVVDVSENPLTANEARTDAATHTQDGMTGYLVTITSQEENDFIEDRVSYDSWIGASDAAEDGK
ncbi:hypothetical protein KC957_02045, partial [Candidatus Saccharibacteria bacterium]|nr:hypothetical protein [Candidatus Saccharibacteria bacterium]